MRRGEKYIIRLKREKMLPGFQKSKKGFIDPRLKRFLILEMAIIVLLIAGLGLWTLGLPARLDEEKAVITIGPYLQNVGPDGITISWETDRGGDRGRVDFGLTSDYGMISERNGEFTPCQNFIHHHTLSGLRPASLYHYRVSSKGATSADYTFRTAPEGPAAFQFVVYGDSRSALIGYRTAHPDVVRAIIETSPADLVFSTGDLVDNGGLCRGWEEHHGWAPEFFQPAAPLISTTPICVAAGNHEYYASPEPHLIIDPPTLYRTYFDPAKRNTTWYSFIYGCARFIILDSNINRDSGNFLPGSPQYLWLEEELKRPEPQWRIVLLHHPPFASRKTCNVSRAVMKYLAPLFEKYSVPLVFAGHFHFYERSFKSGVHYITTAGGGAPLYKDDRTDLNPYRVVSVSVHHYCHVAVSPRRIIVTAKDNNGDVLDRLPVDRIAF